VTRVRWIARSANAAGNRLAIRHAVQGWSSRRFSVVRGCGARHRNEMHDEPNFRFGEPGRAAFAGRHGHRVERCECGPSGSADACDGLPKPRMAVIGAFRAHSPSPPTAQDLTGRRMTGHRGGSLGNTGHMAKQPFEGKEAIRIPRRTQSSYGHGDRAVPTADVPRRTGNKHQVLATFPASAQFIRILAGQVAVGFRPTTCPRTDRLQLTSR